MVIEQIQHQLERLVPIHSVTDLTVLGNPLERELAMIKVAGKGDKHAEAHAAGRDLPARRSSTPRPGISSSRSPASKSRIEQFIAKLQPLGLVEVARTGLAAISRGPERM